MEFLRQRGKKQTKLDVDKIVRTYLLSIKKGVSSADEKITRNDNNKLKTLYYTFVTSGKNYKGAQNFRKIFNEKTKRNLKLLKDKIHFFI